MKAGRVDVISRVIIKPSSSPATETLKLSFLDQLVPPFYVPVIFFYLPQSHSDAAQTSRRLKESLPDALALFYPFAGKLHPDSLSVQCTGAGADFIEARVHARLPDVIAAPNMDALTSYLPVDPATVINSGEAAPPPLLSVQVNRFDCGGMAHGICASHQVADAASLLAFVATWAEISRENKLVAPPLPPTFDLARHFPPKDLSGSGSGFSPSIYAKREKLVTKRLVFDEEKLSALLRAASGSTVTDPTRVELVSAFLWQSLSSGGGKARLSAAWHVVNLRPRISSREMGGVFGNCILKRFVFSSGEGEFHELVSELRKGLREIDEEYIWKAGRGDDYLKCIGETFDLVMNGGMESCGFSSWRGFPVYEVDFGMGKPAWVSPTSCPEKNVCFLMGTKDGDGIEVWVNVIESMSIILDNKFNAIGI